MAIGISDPSIETGNTNFQSSERVQNITKHTEASDKAAVRYIS